MNGEKLLRYDRKHLTALFVFSGLANPKRLDYFIFSLTCEYNHHDLASAGSLLFVSQLISTHCENETGNVLKRIIVVKCTLLENKIWTLVFIRSTICSHLPRIWVTVHLSLMRMIFYDHRWHFDRTTMKYIWIEIRTRIAGPLVVFHNSKTKHAA